MARRIEGTIYKITYTALWHDFVECSSKEDLFKYVAKEIINGQVVTSVNEMCKDGSTPKVKIHTDKDFKKILKQYQNPPVIIVKEVYWTNRAGCHYSLTPINEIDKQIVSQFWRDTTSLKRARSEANEWIKRNEENGIKIVIEKR